MRNGQKQSAASTARSHESKKGGKSVVPHLKHKNKLRTNTGFVLDGRGNSDSNESEESNELSEGLHVWIAGGWMGCTVNSCVYRMVRSNKHYPPGLYSIHAVSYRS